DKQRLLELILISPLQSVKYIIDNYEINLKEAKYIINHINTNYGHCKRCNFDKLDEEYIKCPKCGALNFNWK
ncbi:MAG: Com family DNA-binding transcriptional regulator, partial [Bacteroidia bacterium]